LTDQLVPVGVTGLTAAPTQLSLGDNHTCAVTSDLAAKCWGLGSSGQIGDDSFTTRLTPVNVGPSPDSQAAASLVLMGNTSQVGAGGRHTCAVAAGGAYCWGLGASGQLGNGAAATLGLPSPVTGLGAGVSTVDGGDYHSCALTTAGGVKCWGSGTVGSLGDGANSHALTPQDVSGLTSGVSAISVGGRHSCALTTAGGVKCWGLNTWGQLGNGTNTNSNVPVDVTGLTSGVVAIAAGGYHTCAITTGGAVKCWGYNRYGSLGNGSVTDSNVPVSAAGMSSLTASITAGNLHNCAVRTNGVMICWGDNRYGQLGIGTYNKHSKGARVLGYQSGGAASVAAGRNHTCATTTSGSAKCWGNGGNGQLGHGSLNVQPSPVDVLGFAGG
jgi:alpha-tubulin suppressor-like RCC1 family protein